MTTVASFNTMLLQFCDELITTFPNEPNFKKYKSKIDKFATLTPRKVVTMYMNSMSPHAPKLMAKDESLILVDSEDIKFLADLHVKTHWTPELSSGTKDAIWQYLQTLYIIGSTISMLPDETLTAIEDMAKKMSEDPESLSKLLGSSNLMETVLGKNTVKK